jgi:hypothetical protein
MVGEETVLDRNIQYLAMLHDVRVNILSNTNIIHWAVNAAALETPVYFCQQYSGYNGNASTLIACKNLFQILNLCEDHMQDASQLYKYKLLKPILYKAKFYFGDFDSSDEIPDARRQGTASLEAAMSYLGAYLRPRAEFRRVHDLQIRSRIEIIKGGKLLPMYLIALYNEDPSTRRLLNQPRNLSCPSNQLRAIAVDLREGRGLIYSDIAASPICYSEEAFDAIKNEGICCMYRVCVID